MAIFAFVAVACSGETSSDNGNDQAKQAQEKAVLKKKTKQANRVCRKALKSTITSTISSNGWVLLDYKYEPVATKDVEKPGDSLGPYEGKWSAFCGAGVSYYSGSGGFKQIEKKLITAYAYQTKGGRWVFDGSSVEEDNLN